MKIKKQEKTELNLKRNFALNFILKIILGSL
jgi:hypothetical protein